MKIREGLFEEETFVADWRLRVWLNGTQMRNSCYRPACSWEPCVWCWWQQEGRGLQREAGKGGVRGRAARWCIVLLSMLGIWDVRETIEGFKQNHIFTLKGPCWLLCGSIGWERRKRGGPTGKLSVSIRVLTVMVGRFKILQVRPVGLRDGVDGARVGDEGDWDDLSLRVPGC